MADPTLYLFDGFNLLHAGGFADVRELRDTLASFVALRGARGILVFDGSGEDEAYGPLEVRWARHADTLLERLAAENRAAEEVCLLRPDDPRHVRSRRDEGQLADVPRRPRAGRAPGRAGLPAPRPPGRRDPRAPRALAPLAMKPHVAVITLGVRDLQRAGRFYAEGLGWPIQQEDFNWVCFTLGEGESALALYPWDKLAADAHVPAEGTGFRGVTLAYTVRSEERVDEVLAEAERAGGKVVKRAERAAWGGYSGYFADPEGYLWEVATGATQLPFSE
jgi:uncharacterized protein